MYIQRIEIQYFRSIYKEVISDLKNLNIFTGKNDVGKSNFLKALNLFFNNETDSGVPFIFEENFNFQRLGEVRKDSIKGKQYIQIKVTFIRGNRSEKTLPKQFTITKKWLRNDIFPSIVANDMEKRLLAEGKSYSDRSKSSLTAYLNKIRYIYIPAIKDAETFRYILSQLRETIYNDKLLDDTDLKASMELLSDRISHAAKELNEEFNLSTGIAASLSSPKSVSELYRSIDVDTVSGNSVVNLDKRGDGIRVRYLPSILHYIALNASNMYIWGFEEPENSLEYMLALQMAKKFEETYCKCSMIFCTSHSPAFIGLDKFEHTTLFRCFRDNENTKTVQLDKVDAQMKMSEELGYIQLQKELYSEFNRKLEEWALIKHQKDQLMTELQQMTTPVLYTEGITDVQILTTAWEKLYDTDCPFAIKSCNTLREEDGSAAGCDVLKDLLCTTQPDCPQIIIGLFDRDKQGIKSYGLNANFIKHEEKWKRHKNGRAYAMLLPTPAGKELFAEYENLCIEYYFEKADIDKRVDGKGLKLTPIPIENKFRGKSVESRIPTEMHFHEVDKNTKRFFADNVVPSFPPESFVHFKKLFEQIQEILSV